MNIQFDVAYISLAGVDVIDAVFLNFMPCLLAVFQMLESFTIAG